MSVRAFKFFVVEGTKSFFKNGLMSVASVVTVSMCLILCGLYVIFSMNLNYAAKQVETNYEIQLFIEEGTSDTRIADIGKELNGIDNVNTVVFVSKDQAFNQWKEGFKDNLAILEGLEDDNPLRDSFKITLHDLKQTESTMSQVNNIQGVAYVKNNKDSIDKLVDLTGKIKNASFYFMVFFALISVFIISNTIRITVFARRREVNIMKFVGATDWFIRWPFVIEGILVGLIGAVISVLIVSQSYGYFLGTTGVLINSTIQLYEVAAVISPLVISLAGMGIIIGALGSAMSLRRHLYV
jgi:cell division transport system permease protein